MDPTAWAIIMSTLAEPAWKQFTDVALPVMLQPNETDGTPQTAAATPSQIFTCMIPWDTVCSGIWDQYVSPCDGLYQTCEECYQDCLSDCLATYDNPNVCWTYEDMHMCILDAQRRRDNCRRLAFRDWYPPLRYPVDTP